MSSISDIIESIENKPVVEEPAPPLESVDVVKMDEIVKTEIVVKKERNAMGFVDIVSDFLGQNEEKAKFIPPVGIELVKKLAELKGGSHLGNIEIYFTKMLKDKKIDMGDVPEIVGIMEELYLLVQDFASAGEVSNAIYMLFELLITYKLDKVDVLTQHQKETFLQTMKILLDICAKMIELKDNNTTKKKYRCWLLCG